MNSNLFFSVSEWPEAFQITGGKGYCLMLHLCATIARSGLRSLKLMAGANFNVVIPNAVFSQHVGPGRSTI